MVISKKGCKLFHFNSIVLKAFNLFSRKSIFLFPLTRTIENNGSVWVYYKVIHQKSEEDRITCSDLETSRFSVIDITDRSIHITHKLSGLSVTFVAPVNVFKYIHSKSVVCLDVTSGGLGVSACAENELQIWETENGVVRRNLVGHVFDVYVCKFFPSNVVILSGSGDMQLKIWDAITGINPVTLKGHHGAVLDIAIIDKGKNIISVSKDGTACLWSCGQAVCIDTLYKVDCAINCCTILEQEIERPECTLAGQLENGTLNKILVLGCEDGSLVLLNISTREVLNTINFQSSILCVACILESFVAVGLEDGRLIYLNAKDDKYCKEIHDSMSPLQSICCLHSGVLVGRRDGMCQYYNLEGLSPCQLTGSDLDPIYSIAHDNKYVYTACRDAVIRKYLITDIQLENCT